MKSKSTKVFISAVINGAIAYVGAMLTLLTSLPGGATMADVGEIPLFVAAATGLMTALKDAQAALKTF